MNSVAELIAVPGKSFPMLVLGDGFRDLPAGTKLYAEQQYLVDALKTLLDCFVDDPLSWMNNQSAAIEKARDAIFKATGE